MPDCASSGGVLLVCVLLAGGRPGEISAQARPEGEMRWRSTSRSRRSGSIPARCRTDHTVLGPLRAARRAGQADARQPHVAEPGRVLDGQRGREGHEFKLREGLNFHNGDPFTAEDVKFSFHRAKGSKVLHDKVREVVVVGPARVRFVLHEPWPDFDLLRHHGDGAGWIVPRSTWSRWATTASRKLDRPRPYKFVSNSPGVELVMEANESYWRKTPSVKRLVFKSVVEPTTRMAMLKRGEVDVAYPARRAPRPRRSSGIPTSSSPSRAASPRSSSTSSISGIRSRRGPTSAFARRPTTPSTARR